MALRWSEKETDALVELRKLLKDDLVGRPAYPDVVGDRRMLRFLRGKQNNVQEAAKMFSAFLKWRDENKVDDIRNQILYGGLDTPFKFPNGKKIIDLAPQIIISSNARDNKGQPLVLEQYSFSPSEMFARVTIKDYLLFLVYALEYRALVMEQMSHEKEEKYLAEHPNPEDREDGYGVVLLNFCIRDLQGVGISHLTGKGKQIIEAAINIGLPNYPEYLGKCHMVNVPWVFTSMWFFIKGLLDEFILAKINLTSSKFMDALLKDMPLESIPKALGGKFELYNESYAFDTSPTGPFYTPPQSKALVHASSTNSLGSITSLPSGVSGGSGSGNGGSDSTPPRQRASPTTAASFTPPSSGDKNRQTEVSPKRFRRPLSPINDTRPPPAAVNNSNCMHRGISRDMSGGTMSRLKHIPSSEKLAALTSQALATHSAAFTPHKMNSTSSFRSSDGSGGGIISQLKDSDAKRSFEWRAYFTTPACITLGGFFVLLLALYPAVTLKFVVVPLIFALFILFVL